MKLEEAKEVILKHLNESLNVKTTKWVWDEDKQEYIEVDAGYSKEEIKVLQDIRCRDFGEYYELKELLEDLI